MLDVVARIPNAADPDRADIGNDVLLIEILNVDVLPGCAQRARVGPKATLGLFG